MYTSWYQNINKKNGKTNSKENYLYHFIFMKTCKYNEYKITKRYWGGQWRAFITHVWKGKWINKRKKKTQNMSK